MKELFNDIRNTEDLEGIIVFSVEGKLIYQEFLYAPTEEINNEALQIKGRSSISLGYIAESIKRTGEYAGDIAELVINHLVNE